MLQDRREFLDRLTAIGAVAVFPFQGLASVGSYLWKDPAREVPIQRLDIEQGRIFGQWNDVSWWDLVPGDLIRCDERNKVWQVEELPHWNFSGNGFIGSVGVKISWDTTCDDFDQGDYLTLKGT